MFPLNKLQNKIIFLYILYNTLYGKILLCLTLFFFSKNVGKYLYYSVNM